MQCLFCYCMRCAADPSLAGSPGLDAILSYDALELIILTY